MSLTSSLKFSKNHKKLKNMRTINLFLALMLLITVEVSSQTSRKNLEEKLPEIENFLQTEMKVRKIPGLVFGIFDENSMVASGTYGLANVQHQVPVKIETIFPLASITKQFTAAAILILQQDGKLKVSDTLCQYLEECPEQWSEITIHQLLTHTSGLPGLRKEDGSPNMMAEYSGIHQMDPVRVGMALLTVMSKQYVFDLIKTDTLDTPMGTASDYSNIGYILLGIVIDNIAGSYRGFLEERIFQPVGMKNTYLKDGETIHYNVAGAYTLRDGELIKNEELYITEIGSAGHVFSNMLDLQKWDAVLNTEHILTEKSKQLLWQKHVTLDKIPILDGYGYGWGILKDKPKKVVWHNGSAGTEFLKAVDDKMGIVILTNLGEGNYDRIKIHGLVEGVANILGIYQK